MTALGDYVVQQIRAAGYIFGLDNWANEMDLDYKYLWCLVRRLERMGELTVEKIRYKNRHRLLITVAGANAPVRVVPSGAESRPQGTGRK